jgi:predicted O-methyltransferase YrrM
MNLSEYLEMHNIRGYEGHSQQIGEQMELLNELALNAESIMEIGFNVGHSAEIFLSTHSSRKVVSFDIGYQKGYYVGKGFLDLTYPYRHTLIIGDSKKTVPEFTEKTKEKFDLIFVDGGHEYETSYKDLMNCRELAHKDTVVIVDDTVFTKEHEQEYTIGPTQVWLDLTKEGIIHEVGRIEFQAGRGMSWGYYNL